MTKRSLPGIVAAGALFGMLCGVPAFAQNSTAPDNTKVNKMDRDAGRPTADQAKNTKSDRELMKEIRKSIVADKSLSTYAHNVKVVAQHGRVTLEGPVRSEDERKTIESHARDVAGESNVTNQLTVKEAKDKK